MIELDQIIILKGSLMTSLSAHVVARVRAGFKITRKMTEVAILAEHLFDPVLEEIPRLVYTLLLLYFEMRPCISL